MYDHISPFGKQNLMNSCISSATILNLLAESYPKLFPPQVCECKINIMNISSALICGFHKFQRHNSVISVGATPAKEMNEN